MKRMLFNATQAEEIRVAIVDGQNLIDIDIETLGKEQRKGNIYKAVITRIEPSLEACFVDYGTDRHGFLPFKEISRSYFQNYEGGRPRIQEVLSEDQELIVQVEKDERGNKGAALTTYVSLAGRYLVLMPNNPRGGGVSRRIDGEERQELKEIMGQLSYPKGMSLIARTAGIGRTLEELEWDLNYLLQLWNAIESKAKEPDSPRFLFQEDNLVNRAIRDYFQPDIGEILIDTEEIYEHARQFMQRIMPANVSRIKLYKEHTPLFNRFQIEHQIESAFSRSVNLPSGGAIVIDHTEALVSIDVNSARSIRGADIEDTARKTNIEAAEEIARQLRLRDLGGLIVIDFIDMENQKNQRDVEQTLREALRHDRARVQTSKLSRFGLLELSRQRLKPSLGETSHIACPRCHGIGFIRGVESSALHILRIIQEAAMKENTAEIHAQVPVDVATFLLNEKRSELFSLEESLGLNVLLIPNTYLETPQYNVARIRTDDIDEDSLPSYKQVEKPEETTQIKTAEKLKAEQQKPAVKEITPSAPAPMAAQKQISLISQMANWFKKLFGKEKPAARKKNNRRTYNKRPSQRHQNDRNDNRKDRNDRNIKNNKPEINDNQNNSQNNNRRQEIKKVDNRRQNINSKHNEKIAVAEINSANENKEKALTIKETQNTVPTQKTSRPRKQRRDRNLSEQTKENSNIQTDNNASDKGAPSSKAGQTVVSQNQQNKHKNAKPAQQTPKSKELDIHKLGDLVRLAVVHIIPLPTTKAKPAIKQLNNKNNISEANTEKTIQTTTLIVAESSALIEFPQPQPLNPEQFDLGNLIMVSTKEAIEGPNKVETEIIREKGIRRADLLTRQPEQPQEEHAQQLQQIETKK